MDGGRDPARVDRNGGLDVVVLVDRQLLGARLPEDGQHVDELVLEQHAARGDALLREVISVSRGPHAVLALDEVPRPPHEPEELLRVVARAGAEVRQELFGQ